MNQLLKRPSQPVPVPRVRTARENLLASKIAETLGDPAGLEEYRYLAHTRDHALLQKALDQVAKVPPKKIRKSKRALFFYILHRDENTKS